MSVAQAKARLVEAFAEFLDELTMSPAAQSTNPSPRKATAQQVAQPTTAQRRPNVGVTMPAAATQGKALPTAAAIKAPKELSEETRGKSVKDATEIAIKVAKVTGGTGGYFDEALRGQLALNHIPFDAEVLKRLTAAAQ